MKVIQKEVKEKKKRTSKTDLNYLKTKELIVKDKLENPEIKVIELAEKYDINKSQVTRTLQKEISKLGNGKNEIVDNSVEIIVKGQEIIKDFISKLESSDIKTQSDLNLLTSSLKNQYSLVNMIENYSNGGDNKHIIPLNIQINIKNKD